MPPNWEIAFRARPFMPAAILLVCGICLGRFAEPPLEAVFAAFFCMLPLAWWRRLRPVVLTIGVLLLGTAIYTARYEVRSAADLRVRLTGEPTLATIRGELVETPSLRSFYSGEREIEYSYAVVRASAIKLDDSWQSASGLVSLSMRGAVANEFFRGRQIEAYGVIAHPSPADAPGLFDFREYLHNQRIFFQLRSENTNEWRLISFEAMPVAERFRRWAKEQLAKGVPEDESLGIIWAMALGWKQSMSGEMKEAFMRTGTMHIIAISGLHVVCIGAVFFFLARFTGIPRPIAGLIVLGVVWFYTLSTGMQSSAIRSALMTAVVVGGWVLMRPPDLLNSVCAAAVLILLAEPEQLFQASFQLSFAVVGAMALVAERFRQLGFKYGGPLGFPLFSDPYLPPQLRPRWQRWLDRPAGYLCESFMVSLVCWVGSLPLTVYYFNLVTPISLIANMIAVPLSSISLAASAASLIAPFASPVLNWIAWAVMWVDIRIIEWCASLPFAYFHFPKSNASFFLLFFGALAAWTFPIPRPPRLRLATVALLAAAALAWVISAGSALRAATLTVLPCAGTPTLVDLPGKAEDLLVDCSNERDAEYVLKRFVRGQGTGSISSVALSHGDINHAGGFPIALREYAPKVVFTSEARALSRSYRDAILTLEKQPDRWKKLAEGDLLGGWRVLHPGRGRGFRRADDNALVLKREIRSWRILHLSDLGTAGQEKLLDSGQDLRADIVIAGMPESGEPLHPDLLKAIAPSVIILGTTKFPYTAAGSPELRRRLESSGAMMFFSSDDRAVTISFSGAECQISSMSGKGISLSHADQ